MTYQIITVRTDGKSGPIYDANDFDHMVHKAFRLTQNKSIREATLIVDGGAFLSMDRDSAWPVLCWIASTKNKPHWTDLFYVPLILALLKAFLV